tara:strand:- start:140 stop:625 length:486 start_codon:yes stop_codon:yes gene_type:complete
MIYKEYIKEHKVFSPHLIKLINKAPGTKLREIIKTDWTLDQKINKEYFKFLLPYLNEPLKKFKRKLYRDKEVNLEIDKVWYQVYSKNSHHVWHTHAHVNFACVYYLKLTNSKHKTLFHNIKPIDIKEGDFLIFPAWLVHCSPIIESKDKKIIISFNLNCSL